MQQAHFNAIAQTYDTDFSFSKIGRMQRKRVWRNLMPYLKDNKPKSILEINCGTGVDAYWLSKQGNQVIATDISANMIACAENKKQPELKQQPDFMVCGFDDLANQFKGKTFDVIFSNFAGLNCVDEAGLKKLNHDFVSLLKPNGQLIMVLLGKHCWMEQLYFWAKGLPDKAKRRQSVDMVELGKGHTQPTYCYSVHETAQLFSSFQLTTYKPVGIAIPPSYLEPIIKKFPFLTPIVQLAEYCLGNISFLSDYADHTFLAFRKK
ncbi:MAG: class I SAM-dependent methyltransferase [Bacteroidetes bacterium]|nr:MAG: class I SAM-dependent methyltransferase [Bacteroidota bacterium]